MHIHMKQDVPTRIFGFLVIVVFAAQLLLCFRGPLAFVHKPTLMLFPPFHAGLSDDEAVAVTGFLERELALAASYSLVGSSFMEEYFIRTDPDFSRTKLNVKDSSEALAIAQELDLERYAIATIWKTRTSYQISLSVRLARDGHTVRTARTYATLEDGEFSETGEEKLRDKLMVQTRGLGLTDYLVLMMLGLQLVVGIVALSGRRPGVLVDLLLAPAIVLFLFAFIHARSANMDYVQRYIANGGALKLAQSTAKAQAYAFLRYGPVLLLAIGYQLIEGMRIRRAPRSPEKFLKPSWINRIITPWPLLWTMASAFFYSIAFPSFIRLDGLAWLAWISLIPLFLVLISTKTPMAIFYGVAFGTVQALIVNYWHGTYNYVTLHMITISFAIEYTLFMIPLVLTIRVSGRWGFLTVPALWTLFDYLRSSGILAYPWALAGTSQHSFLALIQIASITGVWGIGFVVLSANAGIAWSLAARHMAWRWPTVSKELVSRISIYREDYLRSYRLRRRISALLPTIIGVSVVAIAVAAGAVILGTVRERLADAPDSATIVLAQQNTDPRKHEYKKNTDILMELTDEAMAELQDKPDLVAWPEGGFKLDIRYWSNKENSRAYWGRVVTDFLEYQKRLGTWLITGTQDHKIVSDGEAEKKLNYNSSVLLDDEGQISMFYHKMRLVPFSEHFPLDKEKYAALYEMFQEYDISNWTIGERRDIFQHDKMRIATPICFEDVFPDHVRRFVLDDVDVILNMSNDYWSLSPVEGRQHGILSVFRAVENQRPVLRSTSSGYTVAISAAGEIHPGAPEPYTAGYTIVRVPLPENPPLTFYTRHGDWFPRACGILALAIISLILLASIARYARRFSAAGRDQPMPKPAKRYAG